MGTFGFNRSTLCVFTTHATIEIMHIMFDNRIIAKNGEVNTIQHIKAIIHAVIAKIGLDTIENNP